MSTFTTLQNARYKTDEHNPFPVSLQPPWCHC